MQFTVLSPASFAVTVTACVPRWAVPKGVPAAGLWVNSKGQLSFTVISPVRSGTSPEHKSASVEMVRSSGQSTSMGSWVSYTVMVNEQVVDTESFESTAMKCTLVSPWLKISPLGVPSIGSLEASPSPLPKRSAMSSPPETVAPLVQK